jgi:phosphatidylserine decarboxylase
VKPIPYIDRASGKIAEEKVFGGASLEFLYGKSRLGLRLRDFLAANAWVSKLFGWWQNQPWTHSHILPFFEKYGIDATEFLEAPESFRSFNDFFIRKLKASARPIDNDPTTAVIPADARYLFFDDVDLARPFQVKSCSLNLAELLGSARLASHFAGGSVSIARLCPSDYHRFHFPCDGIASQAQLINGFLYSVNPIALKQNLSILWQNKRMLTLLQTPLFGKVAYVEVGAMSVGSIHQTYQPDQLAEKGAEKGYFSFGGSMLILLFEAGKIHFSQDLLDASITGYEIRCLMGEVMGKKIQ